MDKFPYFRPPPNTDRFHRTPSRISIIIRDIKRIYIHQILVIEW